MSEFQTKEVSSCCKAVPIEDYKQNPRDPSCLMKIYTCDKCLLECDVEEVCELCDGSGEVTVSEQVWPNEPHMADIGSEKCICKLSFD